MDQAPPPPQSSTVPVTLPPSLPHMPTPVANSQTGPTIQYAGIGRRLVAALLDGVVLWIVNFIIGVVFNLAIATASKVLSDMYLTVVSTSVNVLLLLINISYYIYFTGSRGQTLGKMALGIKVVKIETMQPPGYVSAFLREVVGKFLSTLVLLLGYFWALWDKRKQAWHDKIAGTIVVRV